MTIGTLDPSFGDGGRASADFRGPAQDTSNRVLVQDDGKVIVAGTTVAGAAPHIAVARYNPDGSLDTAFATNGVADVWFNGADFGELQDIELAPGGKLVLLGNTVAGAAGLARLDADGSRDFSFGGDGDVVLDFGVSSVYLSAGIAVQTDGGVVVGMSVDFAGDPFAHRGFAAARINPDGSPDDGSAADSNPSDVFGVAGVATAEPWDNIFDEVVTDIAVDSHDRVVLSGWALVGPSETFVVARFDPRGGRDTTFGFGTGHVSVRFPQLGVGDFGGQAIANSVAIGAGDSVFMGGTVTHYPTPTPEQFQQAGLVKLDATGQADPTFGNNGIVTVESGLDETLLDLAVDRVSGAITASTRHEILRFNPDGSADASFGQSGTVVAALPFTLGGAIALVPGGGVAAAGFDTDPPYDFGVTRYTASGAVDSAFGGDGTATIGFDGSRMDYGRKVLTRPDGKLILIGRSEGFGGQFLALARFNPDGSPDASFGEGGQLLAAAPFDISFAAYALDAAGGILIGGSHFNAGEPATLAVARLSPDGSPDGSFGDGGIARIDLHGNEDTTPGLTGTFGSVAALAVDPEGRIVAAGNRLRSFFDPETFTFWMETDFATARLHPDGTLDETFGDGGLVITDVGGRGDAANSVTLAPDGGIVVGGMTGDFMLGEDRDAAIARYLPDGTLDPAFGDGGRVKANYRTDQFDQRSGDFLYDLAVQADGKVVGTGSTAYIADDGFTYTQDMTVLRLNVDGTLDASFGAGGFITTDVFTVRGEGLGSGFEDGDAVAIQPDGMIVVAGTSFNGPLGQDILVARYAADGSLDPNFGRNGVVLTSFGPSDGYSDDSASDVTFDAEGGILVAGASFLVPVTETGADMILLRYRITDEAENPPPAAAPVSVSTTQDTPVVITLAGSDPDGDRLTYSVTQPARGSLTANADGTYTYLPAPGVYGLDAFDYTVSDPSGQTATARVSINVARSTAGTITSRPDGDLVVNGSDDADTIGVSASSHRPGYLTVSVTTSGLTTSTDVPAPAGRVYVFGYAGNDLINVDKSVANSSRLYGDGGDDRLALGTGGGAAFGGDGADALDGGAGRDILVGGPGADHLTGDSGDDVLIAGMTDADDRLSPAAHAARYESAVASWGRTDVSFADRVNGLASAFNDNTVIDDGAVDVVDSLNGGAGSDWFIYSRRDKVVGVTPAEANVDLLVT